MNLFQAELGRRVETVPCLTVFAQSPESRPKKLEPCNLLATCNELSNSQQRACSKRGREHSAPKRENDGLLGSVESKRKQRREYS